MHVYVIICCICRFRGIRDCLVTVTPYLAGTFKHFRIKSRLLPRVREGYGYASCTSDPFISPGRTPEVEEHNRRNPVALIIDLSHMMVDITIMLLSTLSSKISCKGWTGRRYQGLGHSGPYPWKEVECMHNLHILQIIAYCTYHDGHIHLLWCDNDLHIMHSFYAKHIKTHCHFSWDGSFFLTKTIRETHRKKKMQSIMCQMKLSDGQILRT